MIESLEPCVFVKEILKPPSYLLLIAPAQFSQAIQEVLLTAALQREHRLHRPPHPMEGTLPTVHDPTLLPTAKLPRHAVNLHMDSYVYEKFVAAFEEMKHEFVIGPYLAWCNAKRVLDHLMARASTLLPRPEELMIQSWWDDFVREMAPWEEMLEKLRLPPWETVLEDVERAIEEAVDLEGEWERIC
ncbi:hypothetical protein ACJ72_02974 [Emergomyces africanus]|uniref:Uncharacterized protein n=1 Tax=Emergomyces africanus TaxID=1955775 RepID=A0A1B7P0Y4_9EURO|nr:hypothetical protein ACJ72_02974 [Emergomyces africanus]